LRLFLVYQKMTTFKEIGLNTEIQSSLDDLGFTTPSPIQEAAIPFLLQSNKDLIAFAQTGTGKTAAFSLPIINRLETETKNLQAIILCPTRELCLQISKDINSFIKHSKAVSVTAVYGGAPITAQIDSLRRGANIVVGTPGRVLDLIKRKVLKLQNIRWLVLDEADEMLDMGFKEDLDTILAETPKEKQTLLFSATMSPIIQAIARKYMTEPHEISIGTKNIGAENVTHEYYIVQAKDRYEALRRIVDSLPSIYGILFCRTRRETQEVADKLKENHYNAEALHGEITQNMRTQIMDRFRKKTIQLLVATDVAARGIDVSDLTHVINYNLPDANETYVHRSGRTGRASKSGVSITILHPKEVHRIMDIQRKIGKIFEQKQVPSGENICRAQLLNFAEKIKNTKVNKTQIKQYLPAVNEILDGLDRDDLVNHFIAHELNHFLEVYEDSRDLNTASKAPREIINNDNFVNFKINIGRRDGIDIKALFGLINSIRELKGAEIGKVDLFPNHCVFGIDKGYREIVINIMNGASFHGKKLEAFEINSQSTPRSGSSYGNSRIRRNDSRNEKRGYIGSYKKQSVGEIKKYSDKPKPPRNKFKAKK